MFKDSYDERHLVHGDEWILARTDRNVKDISKLNRVSFEGWAAGIAAAGVAVSAGSAIASGVQKSDAAGDLASAAAKKPKIVPATFDTPDQNYQNYIDSYNNNSPYLQTLVDQQNATDNNKYQQQLGLSNPSLTSSIATQGANANALLNGQIPADVQAQVQRSAAYQALTGQGSTDSGSAHALTARDLGTTSLGLQQQGSALLAQSLANTKAINPYYQTADSLMLTPQQLLSRSDANNAYANAVQNQNNNIQYQNGLQQVAANSYNPFSAALTSGAGVLGTSLNGSLGQSLAKGLSGTGSSYTNTSTGGGTLGAPDTYGYNEQVANTGSYNSYLDPAYYDDAGNYTGGG